MAVDDRVKEYQGDAAARQAAEPRKTGGKSDSSAPRLKPLDIKAPDRIGRYTIGKRIGSGTCGVVHLAEDELLRRTVAIKLSPVGETNISTGKVPGAQRAYQTEIVAAGQLAHPNIVTVFDAGQYEDLNYLVMEVVEGSSLKEFGKGRELLPVHRALEVIVDCCTALDYSHRRGILHRDIKPANIMLGKDGSVKILDFGIAVGLRDIGGLNRHGPTLGTPNYMSPEQILGHELGAASDFYSLGTVLFEMLTGRQLFKARKVKELFRTVVQQPAPRLDEVNPSMEKGLADVLAKALAKKPKDRFQSGREMAQAIEPWIENYRLVEERPNAQLRFIRQLQKQAFFEGFSDVEVARLLEIVTVRSFSAGEVLVAAGDAERRLFIITDGMARRERDGQLVEVVGEGAAVGAEAFVNGAPEPESTQAMTTVNALELTSDALSNLPPRIHLRYFRHISSLLARQSAGAASLQPDCAL